jgi:hypothetical protein
MIDIILYPWAAERGPNSATNIRDATDSSTAEYFKILNRIQKHG